MTPEEYIAIYGANLTPAERRYIRVFGAPQIPGAGGGRSPYTSGLHVADAPVPQTQLEAEARTRMERLDIEAESYE